jgi:hypothetical protein
LCPLVRPRTCPAQIISKAPAWSLQLPPDGIKSTGSHLDIDVDLVSSHGNGCGKFSWRHLRWRIVKMGKCVVVNVKTVP